MAINSKLGWHVDYELTRLRHVWVDAYWAWTRIAGDKAATNTGLSDEQHAALRRYRAAETAYHDHRRMLTAR
jgi:hypothetical protein